MAGSRGYFRGHSPVTPVSVTLYVVIRTSIDCGWPVVLGVLVNIGDFLFGFFGKFFAKIFSFIEVFDDNLFS